MLIYEIFKGENHKINIKVQTLKKIMIFLIFRLYGQKK